MKTLRCWTAALAAGLLIPTGMRSLAADAAANRPAPDPAPAVPEPLLPLYRELEDTLRQDRRRYPFKPGAPLPVVAPGLFLAGSGFGPAAADSARWRDMLDTVDAYRAAGMTGVSVMIAAPDLSLGDPEPLLAYYRRLADALHRREMKLYVEHFDNPPFSPHAHKGVQDTPQGRMDFLAMRARELTLIYERIRPDYLSLLTEPETMLRWSHLSLSAGELGTWVGEVAARLKAQGKSPHTLLGAGAGARESEDFVLNIARQPAVDYVDMHLYALTLNGDDLVARFSARVRQVREIRPDIRLTIGETWLYKHGSNEPKGMFNREAFARDNFSCWSPLDQQFLTLLLGLAQKENISVVAPYFSQHLFAYYTLGEADAAQLPPWPACVVVSWSKALNAIRGHQLSPTGEALRAMMQADGK